VSGVGGPGGQPAAFWSDPGNTQLVKASGSQRLPAD
jgi:hypothetical protein